MRSFFGSACWFRLWLWILCTRVLEAVVLLCDRLVGFWLVGWRDVVVAFWVSKGEVDREVWWTWLRFLIGGWGCRYRYAAGCMVLMGS